MLVIYDQPTDIFLVNQSLKRGPMELSFSSRYFHFHYHWLLNWLVLSRRNDATAAWLAKMPTRNTPQIHKSEFPRGKKPSPVKSTYIKYSTRTSFSQFALPRLSNDFSVALLTISPSNIGHSKKKYLFATFLPWKYQSLILLNIFIKAYCTYIQKYLNLLK